MIGKEGVEEKDSIREDKVEKVTYVKAYSLVEGRRVGKG